MWYSIIDLKEFKCEIIKDKKIVAKILGISVPTFDRKIKSEKVILFDRFIIGVSELTKSTRGGNQ